MSNELIIPGPRSVSMWAFITLLGQYYNRVTESLEDYSAANYAKYNITMTEQGASGDYVGTFPTALTGVGIYQIIYKRSLTGTPVEGTDVRQGTAKIDWNGVSVTVPNNLSGALVTRSQAKTWLKINSSSEDDIIDQIVVQSSEVIKKYCNQKFVSATYTEYYDGPGRGQLFLRNYPIISVTSLHEDVDRVYGSEDAFDVSADVLVDKTSGILKLWNGESTFGFGKASIKAVYVAGYATIPYDVQNAALIVIAYSYKRHYQDQKIGIASETIGNRTTTFDITAIPKQARLILDRYKKIASVENGYDL